MSETYNVFLSHNSLDKPDVRALRDWLENHGVSCWLDSKNLKPGDKISRRLGEAMESCASALICIGPHGEGPWMSEEVDSLLNKAIKLSRQNDEFRLIPVLFPGADTSKLRWFLETRLWVDLKDGITDNEAELFRLKSAILGEEGASVDADPHPDF
ncbi:MAG: toll/interleukin-1 receptor domain-containing protein, partial [Verrucomicrobiota bacterium]